MSDNVDIELPVSSSGLCDVSDNINVEIKHEDVKDMKNENMSIENNNSAENGDNQHLLVVDGNPPWLSKILAALINKETIYADIFISTLYILIYESGFTVNGGPKNSSIIYNIKVMREISDYSFLQRMDSSYKFCFTLHSCSNNCVLVAIPVGNIIIVNIYIPECKTISCLSFNMNHFVDLSGNQPELKNRKELVYKFKTELCKIRQILLKDEHIKDPKHILSLPTELLLQVCNYLTPTSYFNFSLSCKGIYYRVYNDESIWSIIARHYLPCRKRNNETWKEFIQYQCQKKRECERRRIACFEWSDIVGATYLSDF